MSSKNKTNLGLRRTASEIKNYRKWMKLLPIAICLMASILIIAYVISSLYMKFGSFTVAVNKLDNIDYNLTLSETSTFDVKSSRLNAEIDEYVTHFSVDWLPDYLDNIDGQHNGDNYIAYTFYCRNEGTKTLTYKYEVIIANMSLGCEKAARIRLYVNGEYTDYAYPRTDGGEGAEPNTTAFISTDTVCRHDIENFGPGEVTKFTIVMWLEGDDPECVDNILGGSFKIDMNMNVVKEGESSSTEVGEEGMPANPGKIDNGEFNPIPWLIGVGLLIIIAGGFGLAIHISRKKIK